MLKNAAFVSRIAKREQHVVISFIPDVSPSGRRAVTPAQHAGKRVRKWYLEKGTEKKAPDAACVGRITFDGR